MKTDYDLAPHDIMEASEAGISGFPDPEVARDLGIPCTDEDLYEHLESSAAVESALARASGIPDGQLEHDRDVREFGVIKCADCNKPNCKGCKY